MNTEKEFTPRKIMNVEAIKKASVKIGLLPIPANAIKAEFVKLFSYFNINDLKSLMIATNKMEWISLKWIELNNINTNQLSIERLISLGLLQIPSIENLLLKIEQFQQMLLNSYLDMFVKDIEEIWSEQEGQFINPLVKDPNSIIQQRICSHFEVYTQNEAENEYVERVGLLAEAYESMVNNYRHIHTYDLPKNLLQCSIASDGYVNVEPIPILLKSFRKFQYEVQSQQVAEELSPVAVEE